MIKQKKEAITPDSAAETNILIDLLAVVALNQGQLATTQKMEQKHILIYFNIITVLYSKSEFDAVCLLFQYG